jgi:hypothetical protein
MEEMKPLKGKRLNKNRGSVTYVILEETKPTKG